jgi:hypothetical protein
MGKLRFEDIPVLRWGNEIVIKGLVMEDSQNGDIVVMLPNEKANPSVSVVEPSVQEWYELQDQLDKCNVEGEGGAILRKGQRQLDQKICWQVYRRDKYKCRYCGINNVPLTVDHIKTWETGGATHPKNLLTCCKKCNRKRGNLDYGSWLQHKYYLEKSKYLTQKEIDANEAIVRELNNMPVMAKPRSR